jgi:methylmalonyl-CoA/ethylmalonyl-CoA epimerase
MANIKGTGNNWKYHHTGVIVRSMDETVKYYESLGLFTFQPEFGGGPGKTRLRIAEIGPNRIELIAPADNSPMFMEFLNTMGDGIHHIAYTVDNLDAERAALEARGIAVLNSMRRPDGSGIAFFDLRKHGGVVIELMQPQK